MRPEGQAAWFRLQDSTRRMLAGDSLQPVVACTVFPGLLLQGPPCSPASAPTPFSQREACQLGGGLERVGSPPPTGWL